MNEESKIVEQAGFWRTHSNAWKMSGMTQQKYCEQEGINYPSFIYQHIKLTKQQKKNGMQFIETNSATAPINNPGAGIHLMLPNGVRIGVSNEVNSGLLQTVLTIAGGLRC